MGLEDQWLVEEGGQFEKVLCLALVNGRLAMPSTETRDTGEGTDMRWGGGAMSSFCICGARNICGCTVGRWECWSGVRRESTTGDMDRIS